MNLGSVTYKNCNVWMFPRDAGIEPVSELFWSSKFTRFVRLFPYNLLGT
jgi:hypothetical protein